MGVVNAKAAAEVDDLNVHEVLVVPRQHLPYNEYLFKLGDGLVIFSCPSIRDI